MERYFGKVLKEYCDKNFDAWHMPGHKRIIDAKNCDIVEAKRYDVTELPGLDDLHAMEYSLKESVKQLANVYGSYRSYYLVNGSTCGILTAISSVCRRGDTIAIARNCHKSVYHAISLLELTPIYIYPDIIEPWEMCGGIRVEQISEVLGKNSDIKAIVFPSPTYEGIVSDVEAIVELAHSKDVCVIVDEAHGAHLEFDAQPILSAIRCGADLVIESLHKTMPCYNQCALLHIGRSYVVRNPYIERYVERYLNVYETSSPSYIFVADMENAIACADEGRATIYLEYYNRIEKYRKQWEKLKNVQLLKSEDIKEKYGFLYDDTKLVIAHNHMSGEQLRDVLERKYGIVVEMASLHYILAISSIMDSEEMFMRFDNALRELDEEGILEQDRHFELNDEAHVVSQDNTNRSNFLLPVIIDSGNVGYESVNNQMYVPGIAWNMDLTYVIEEEAIGCIAADYVTVYPPGIPICVPGEKVTKENVQYLKRCYEAGLTIHGIKAETERKG